MDADLQHDEKLLTEMLAGLRNGGVDLVVASRYCDRAQEMGLTKGRARVSLWSTVLSRALLGVELTGPMSGYFMIRSDVVQQMAPSLSRQGFKILLDIAATGDGKLRFPSCLRYFLPANTARANLTPA